MKLLQTNASMPAPLVDERTGRTVMSGIAKRRVSVPVVQVSHTNIDGDGQGDLIAHGGVDKAIYTYSHDHLPAWIAEIDYGQSMDAPFGENLSVSGLTEDDVRIGDRWQWGEVVLEIAQPRWPCFKLGLHSGHRDLPQRLIESERSGWYSRVIQPGAAPITGQLTLVHRDPHAPTVREAFHAAKPGYDPESALEIAVTSALASRWRSMIQKRYSTTEAGTG